MIENPKPRLCLTLPHPQVTSPLLSVFTGLSIIDVSCIWWAAPVAQLVKNPPAMQETWVQSLGWEDPLEKGTATHSSILAWRFPWTTQSMGSQRVRHD